MDSQLSAHLEQLLEEWERALQAGDARRLDEASVKLADYLQKRRERDPRRESADEDDPIGQ